MLLNNKLRILFNVFFLLLISASVSADDGANSRFFGQWPSVLPPLLAVVFALVTKRVIPALFLGPMARRLADAGPVPAGPGQQPSDQL